MKLHELLAVGASQSTQSNKLRQDLANTFEKKRHLFEQKIVTFQSNGESEAVTEQQSDLQSTVAKELKWIGPHLAKALDIEFQINEANTRAKADIIMPDGAVLVANVPATALLELQKRITELQSLISTIPTLDPAKGFQPDPDAGVGIYRARPVNKNRTAKVQEPLVLYPATPEHPAQTQLVTRDIAVGIIKEEEWSGLITPAQKAEMLDKVETIGKAIRSARSRANEAEVDRSQVIGGAILSYIFG
jgi:uncharacterized FlaG/YvyC family protein